jgi:DNA-binding transcriptional MocR family regulator
LAWAQREKAWIIEDDYDSEFNYDGLTRASLQGLDQYQRTLYIGTFSKTLFPGLRIGFIIVPPQLIKPMVAAKQFQDGYTSALPQMTLFKFIHEDFHTETFEEHAQNLSGQAGDFACSGSSVSWRLDLSHVCRRAGCNWFVRWRTRQLNGA